MRVAPCVAARQAGPVLELRDVSLHLSSAAEAAPILENVSLILPPGHFAAIVGASGCGKSTLLKIIAGLAEHTGGSVRWEGRDLSEDADLDPTEVGYVPQFSIAYDLLDVWESVSASLRLRLRGLTREQSDSLIEDILRQVGLADIADRRVKVLSGGQKRRLALAMELVTSPALLLADEVTSGLDPRSEDEVLRLMHRLARDRDRLVLSVTHSLRHLDLYDSVIVMREGHVVYHGPPGMLAHYFHLEEPEEVYQRLTMRPLEGWIASWEKHRPAYYEHAGWQAPPSPSDALEESEEAPDIQEPDLPEAEAKDTPPARRETLSAPSALSQFFTLLQRRLTLFLRDRAQLGLHLALIFGFPCLVVVFALDGLPAIRNLSMGFGTDLLAQATETLAFSRETSRAGSLVSGLMMFQVVLLTLMGANNAAREIAGERLIFEKEKFGGVRVSSYVASKAVFLAGLVCAQSLWMGLFVKSVCNFPGPLFDQLALLLLVNAAMTAVSLAISSLACTAEQASLTAIYLVGFQLPLSGAVLALPEVLGKITQPFIAAYWGWSGLIGTMRDTRFYEAVLQVSSTQLSIVPICFWVLVLHIAAGLAVTLLGCRRGRWE